jgi:cyclophilin family peptidyl-prolyl cis-trans isomerase
MNFIRSTSPLQAHFFGAPALFSLFLAILLAVDSGRVASAAPIIDPIANVTVPAGKTLIVPVTAVSSNGWPLTYSATSSLSKVTVTVRAGHPNLKMAVKDFGDLVFELFDDLAPLTVETIRGLAQSGFYDNLTFHRVISEFVIQGGDPSGTGGGGPDFRFEDEFHPDAIFTGNGQLAMANAGKDSNGSQFFITIGPQRFLDFNHTLFGQLLRGFDVIEKIRTVPTDANGMPLTPVVIERAGIIPNFTDSVLLLRAATGSTVTATITLSANDGHGGTGIRAFQAQTVADTTDDPPILGPLTNALTAVNTSITLTLTGIDLEKNPLAYAGQLLNASTNHATFTVTSNRVTIKPATSYKGPLDFAVGVRQQGAVSRGSTANPYDIQVITIGVGDQPLTPRGTNFPASQGVAFTNVAVAAFSDADTTSKATNFTAYINWGDGRATVGTVNLSGPGSFSVTGAHRYDRDGTFPVRVQVVDYLGATIWAESRSFVPPALSMTRSFGQPAVSRPAWTTDYLLEMKSDPGPTGAWQPIAGDQGVVIGFDSVFTNVNGPDPWFFRLRRP